MSIGNIFYTGLVMRRQNAPQRKPFNSSTKIALRAIAIPMIIIGIILAYLGFSEFGSFDFSGDSAAILKIFAGSALLGFGGMLLYISFIGRVASYYAQELSPAIDTASSAMGAGISRGIKESGGIKLDTGDSIPSITSATSQEIIKIKCRNCGYLETEDADICSKCGQKI
jgi:hypothetical protein